jgi:hypothetical protein
VIYSQPNIGVPSGAVNGVPGVSQASYHDGRGAVAMGQQFPANAQQEVFNPIYDHYPTDDVYGQPGKINLNQEYLNVAQLSTHSANTAASTPHGSYSYLSQENQVFDPALSQYSQPQLMPQQLSQSANDTQPAFEGLNRAFPHPPAQTFPQQAASPAPAQQVYSRPPHAQIQPQLNSQRPQIFPNPVQPTYDHGHNSLYQHQHSTLVPQQVAYSQQPQQTAPATYHQPGTSQPHQQPGKLPAMAQQSTSASAQHGNMPFSSSVDPALQAAIPVADDSSVTDQASKKRKKAAKKVEVASKSDGDSEHTDSPAPAEVVPTNAENIDSHAPPSASNSAMLAMERFNKRSVEDKARFPGVSGTLYVISEGAIKLPSEYLHIHIRNNYSPLHTDTTQLPRATTNLLL